MVIIHPINDILCSKSLTLMLFHSDKDIEEFKITNINSNEKNIDNFSEQLKY